MKTLLICLMLLAGFKSNGQSKKLNSGGSGRIQVSGEQGQGSPYVKWDSSFANKYYTIVPGRSFLIDTTLVFNRYDCLYFYNNGGKAGFINKASDTLILLDTFLNIYDYKIRYIKRKDGKVIKL